MHMVQMFPLLEVVYACHSLLLPTSQIGVCCCWVQQNAKYHLRRFHVQLNCWPYLSQRYSTTQSYQFAMFSANPWSARLCRIGFGQWFGPRSRGRHFFWWENPPKFRGAQLLARWKNGEDRLSWNTDKGSSSSDCRIQVVHGNNFERFILFRFVFSVFLLDTVKIMPEFLV